MTELYYDKVLRYLKKRPIDASDLYENPTPQAVKELEESNQKVLDKLRATNVIVAPFSTKDFAKISSMALSLCRFEDMPFENFFIETEIQEPNGGDRTLQFSVFVYKERDGDWLISVGSTRDNDFSWFAEISSVVRPEKFPRFYPLCRRADCSHRVVPSSFGVFNEVLCQSTERSAERSRDDCSHRAMIVVALKIMFYVIERIRNPKIILQERKTIEHKAPEGISHYNKNSITYIGKQYVYADKQEPKGGHHAQPIPHDRRAHMRRYRDKTTGQVVKEIPIGIIKVRGGAEAAPSKPKFYKLVGGN